MLVNKLLRNYDEQRCTGRTAALALSAISRAIAKQGQHVYAVDHHAPGSNSSAVHLKSVIDKQIAELGLLHISVAIISSHGMYNNHVRLVSEIWSEK